MHCQCFETHNYIKYSTFVIQKPPEANIFVKRQSCAHYIFSDRTLIYIYCPAVSTLGAFSWRYVLFTFKGIHSVILSYE